METMKKLYIIIVGLSLLVSCQYEDCSSDMTNAVGGKFLTTISSCYISGMTRSQTNIKQESMQNSELAVTVSEENWDSCIKETTRGKVSGTDYSWEGTPNVALYIADSQTPNNCSFTDIPLNPRDHLIYKKYYNSKDVTEDVKNETGSTIASSSFFWDNWGKKDNMPTSANFYGYYPRPCDLVVSDNNYGVKYTSISIFDRSKARSGTTKISYAFMSDQNDENISYHDVMCSFSEDEKANGYYGNINKSQTSNIQLRFKHMFCLLEFEVNKGSYQGACQITELKLSGKQVYTGGTLDVINCQTTPTNGNSEIIRSFNPQNIEMDSPFNTTMIVQPTTDNASIANDDKERLIVSCTINGAKYSCPLPNAKFEAGKKYKINLTLKPSEIIDMQIWDGASVKVGSETFAKENVTLTPRGIECFYVTPNEKDTGVKVFRNGEEIGEYTKEGESYKYALDMDAGKKTAYNIVTYPLGDSGWYVTDGMRVHFDAIWNDKYSKDKQCKEITYWNDLSGHDNDGLLKSFNANNISGWDGTNGLAFDGIDDIVTFFGDIGTSEYTLEFFININPSKEQTSGSDRFHFKRLIGEPDSRYDSFPAVYMTSADYIGFMGQGVDTSFGNTHIFSKKVQYDFVYKNNVITVYINGDKGGSISLSKNASKKQTASLGNRTMDNSRALKATYHSFIMYDKALGKEQIDKNYEINRKRFGETK